MGFFLNLDMPMNHNKNEYFNQFIVSTWEVIIILCGKNY